MTEKIATAVAAAVASKYNKLIKCGKTEYKWSASSEIGNDIRKQIF